MPIGRAGKGAATETIELVALSTSRRYARCRTAGDGADLVVLRSEDVWRLVPGEIATVGVRSRFRHLGEGYVAGDVHRVRLDVRALRVEPIRVTCGQGGAGPRLRYLEQPLRAPELLAGCGDEEEGVARAHQLLERDLRCLDAHAYLGAVAEDRDPERALRHYAVGVALATYSHGRLNGDEWFPWHPAGNAAFLACLEGSARCLDRVGRREDAAAAERRRRALDPLAAGLFGEPGALVGGVAARFVA